MEEENKQQPLYVEDEEDLNTNAKIKVLGIGGGGSNAVNQMIHDKEDLVDYWVLNTDSQALLASPCEHKYVLGKGVTRGLGAGGIPQMGEKAAEDSIEDIKRLVKGSDMVFLAAGEGGGTGTGAAPVVAKAAKEAGCLVLAIVTRPFTFEGKARQKNALEGIAKLKQNVDALIVVSNDKLVFNNGNLPFKEAFKSADHVLAQAVKSITDLILVPGLINLDFADVKATLTGKGLALIGIGNGEGKNKALDAAQNAVNSPLLEASINGARAMMINITAGDDTTLNEIQFAVNEIREATHTEENNVNVVFGVQCDAAYRGKMKVAIIATDFTKDIDFAKAESLSPRSSLNANAPKKEEKKEESRTEQEVKSRQNANPLPDYLRRHLLAEEGMKKEANTEEKTAVKDVIPAPENKEEPSSPEEEDETLPLPSNR